MVKQTMRIDPSRTGLLRRKFLSDLNRRLKRIVFAIRTLLVEEDALGLKLSQPLVLQAYQQFAFTTDANKLRAFQKWLKTQVDAGILVVSGAGVLGQPWTYEYVDSAYRRGMMRAFMDTNKASLAKTPDWYRGTREQFVRTAFAQPLTMSKLELLSTRTFEQLQGITATMSQQLGRVLSMGLVSGWGPLKIAREMQKTVAGISRTRARMLARTEIMHAHAEGQLDSFQLLGVEKLGIIAEWSTAGDDLVCSKCYAMEGQTYTVDEARGLIPLHPNCRCVWIPSELPENRL